MAEKIHDTKLIAALLTSPTLEMAAQAANVSTRTLNRKLKNPKFRSEYNLAKNQVILTIVNHTILLMSKALLKYDKLLESDSERTQLQAARSILQFGIRLMSEWQFEERLHTLEEQIRNINIFMEESNEQNR
jgi:hypothetical protein